MIDDSEKMRWSLKELYSSFDGEDFKNDMKLLDDIIDEFTNWCDKNLSNTDNLKEKLEAYISIFTEYRNVIGRLGSFASLNFAANAKDEKAKKYITLIEKKDTKITEAEVKFSKWISDIKNLDEILSSSEILKKHIFYLKEIVSKSKYILSEKEEVAISKMRLTGSSAWLKLKNQLTSNHKVQIDIEGRVEKLPITKIKNMQFSKDNVLREKAFFAERISNDSIAEGVAAALNGIKGEVLTICELKGYSSPLNMTLDNSRMDEETLNVMLKVMKEGLGYFKRYFLKKAEILGYEDKLPYYDIMAPVGSRDMNFSYEEARDFIVKHFSSFSPEMGDLALKAFESRWIDAEVREGKRGGAFCHNLHFIKESRVLCSYDGNFKNVCTIAHELGHAYHGSILQKESILNSSYPMPLAETASIFAESIVRNAALKTADKDEALVILGAELENCASVIVDIYARFLFEKEVFHRRKDGELSVDEIKDIMVWAQKEAYGDAIIEETFDYYAWVHKPHYYYVERNFYNFPYAFGLLFSKGLYKIYLQQGNDFIEKYNEVLKLTGQANIYDVAKHVEIDLHNEEFWRGSFEIIKRDIDKFCNVDIS
ncbi:oligoendopeptidase F [Clostridium zeae]|uniref:Oligoendopeptidase F n=1 Tax=Clostridium zeae TaxID=2759022 RepID=A0ABQ1EE74_9CLOT|nr:M3 family oligoendopeptidase [Clostridium zeae]GFZ32895.1 oligoendopeptidase F [Clostridium zeae]